MLHGSDFRVRAPRSRRGAQYPSSLVLLRVGDLASAGCLVDAAARDLLGVRPAVVGLNALLPRHAVLIVRRIVHHLEVDAGTEVEVVAVDLEESALLDAFRDFRSDGVGESRGGEHDGGSGEDDFAEHGFLLLKLRNECGTEHPKNVRMRRFSDTPTLPFASPCE